MRITIGDIEYKSKKQAKDFFSKMLAKYDIGETIDEQDSAHLHALIQLHTESEQKIGCGIKRFYKYKVEKWKKACFALERLDGSKTDFSVPHCIEGKAPSVEDEFTKACRDAVAETIHLAKQRHFAKCGDSDGKVECDKSGDRVSLDESHLDHKAPLTFQVIVHTFIAAYDITPTRDMLTLPQDDQVEVRFANSYIRDKFVKYHNRIANSNLQIIRKDLNVSKANERITPPKTPVLIP